MRVDCGAERLKSPACVRTITIACYLTSNGTEAIRGAGTRCCTDSGNHRQEAAGHGGSRGACDVVVGAPDHRELLLRRPAAADEDDVGRRPEAPWAEPAR